MLCGNHLSGLFMNESNQHIQLNVLHWFQNCNLIVLQNTVFMSVGLGFFVSYPSEFSIFPVGVSRKPLYTKSYYGLFYI